MPTKPKNYPVQGLATGDIVPLVVGRIFRRLCAIGLGTECRLINTIHDSIVFDCKDETTAKAMSSVAKSWAERAPEYLQETFGFEFPLPLSVSSSIGANWYEVDQE